MWINGVDGYHGPFPHWWDKRKTIDYLRDGKTDPDKFTIICVNVSWERQNPDKKEKKKRKLSPGTFLPLCLNHTSE